MKSRERTIAELLIQIKAIKLEPANPFLWASGWKSPVYCDNRLILSFPWARKQVAETFSDLINVCFPGVTVISGVATGAIAHGMLVAEKLDLPFSYVRSAPKAHGTTGIIEGVVRPGDRVVVVEDLVSTGRSSLAAVRALQDSGCEILGMVAIFTYGFDIAAEAFREHGCQLKTLTNYNILIETASEMGLITPGQIETLNRWRKDPAGWGNE
jgi:orotate phosphoribosyltransferase